MPLSIGIVGLPQVGKSALFNALTRAQNAQGTKHLSATDSNKATVPVPDERLAALAKIANPKKVTHATATFVDIAGLVKGSSKGEGLGNQFLANIREANAILHIVRCFDDENVAHVEGGINPVRDIEIIETELLLADLESITKYAERIGKLARTDKDVRKSHDAVLLLKEHIEAGNPVSSYPNRDAEELATALHELQLLTDKKTIYVANVSEEFVNSDNDYVRQVRDYAAKRVDFKMQGGSPALPAVVRICAKMEEELAGLPDAERKDFMEAYGVTSSSLDVVVKQSYETVGLISFLTAGPMEVRAWTVRQGASAPEAAGVIHTDFEKGFIAASVMDFDDLARLGSEKAVREAGLMRTEGKDYVMQDGDVVEFLISR